VAQQREVVMVIDGLDQARCFSFFILLSAVTLNWRMLASLELNSLQMKTEHFH